MMLNIWRGRRIKGLDSGILLRFAIPPVVSGGILIALGAWLLATKAPVADTFWPAMVMSLTILLCGIGMLAYRWLLNRSNSADEEN